jgi:putative DNA primase/helicase
MRWQCAPLTLATCYPLQTDAPYPQAQIIIAADNDRLDDKPNTGTDAAEKPRLPWLAGLLPPTDYKADWNDYHQQHGLEVATAAFNDSMYQPQGNA